MLGARDDQAALAAGVGVDTVHNYARRSRAGYDLVVEAAGSATGTAAALAAPVVAA